MMTPSSTGDGRPRLAPIRGKIIGLYVGLAATNVVVWLWTLATFHAYPVLLGTALLAYTFGLRHAIDADHIAAIDNVTRKLMQSGQRPIGVGLFFSLGHSSVVVLASCAIALAASAQGVAEIVLQHGVFGGMVDQIDHLEALFKGLDGERLTHLAAFIGERH